ncbi:MAG: UvrD-helicase domain-containing protein [Bacteroidetes bacterium]|jgi:DNA helicase-2/ATP-dependent DNA helicase PcrA|nr:UvrD-helicase domain-containing protein [Bacteroidota bacterium]
METDFLKDLNKVQQEAVTNYKGASLVIAGAGSGKTRVLTYRIAYLLSQGVPPQSILALTFTNKAAKEMKDRIGKLIGYSSARYLWMGTFHSVFARILRSEADKLGYTSNFTIYDTTDTKSLIKSIIKELILDDQQYKPNQIYGRISSAKNNLITASAYNSNSQIQKRDMESKRPQVGEIYRMYAQRCKKADAMDFDDLLMNTNILFRDFPDALEKYQSLFNYILVDEYQDTNFSQYLIVNKLAANHKNVCVVGDDAQSIYSFRGAKIENILNFRKDYPDYNIYKLEQNYRSTQNIVDAANSVIKVNKNQIEKKVWSGNDVGEKIQVVQTMTDTEEGFVVANSILDTVYSAHLKYQDFAILYRTNAQSRIFEEALRKRNIPYKVYGSLSFYQRKEIKDLLGYFRLIINPNDDEAFKRVVNYPTRGIGQTTLSKIEYAANIANISMWEVLQNPSQHELNINQGTTTKLANFKKLILGFTEGLKSQSAYDLAYQIASETGILKELYNGKTPEEVSRYENIQELLNAIHEFTEGAKEEGNNNTLDQYLENVALLTDADNEKEEDINKVSLMTVHAAKGLEFKNVYIAGLEEELFPSGMSTGTIHELEEERRLFYVAMTRAEQRVMLSYTQTRYKWGNPTHCAPSRFIKEIDQKYLELPQELISEPQEEHAYINDFSQKENGQSHGRPQPQQPGRKTVTTSKGSSQYMKMKDARRVAYTANPVSDDPSFQPDDPGEINTGMEVIHQRFGKGKVNRLEGEFPNKKATVFFDNLGEEKQLLLKFAKLKIVK